MNVPDSLHDPQNVPAYATLLTAIARDFPGVLGRVMADLDDQAAVAVAGDSAAAAGLARACLAYTGNPSPTTAATGGTVYNFTHPAHLSFELVSTGGVKAARRRARESMAMLLATDMPLMAVSGALPGQPAVLNATVWLGSAEGRLPDTLELEGVD